MSGINIENIQIGDLIEVTISPRFLYISNTDLGGVHRAIVTNKGFFLWPENQFLEFRLLAKDNFKLIKFWPGNSQNAYTNSGVSKIEVVSSTL